MTRSYKKAFVTISKRMTDNIHSRIRQRITNRLAQIDPEEPDEITLLDIEADTKEMGLEDWGTKFGLEFDDLDWTDKNVEEWEQTRTEFRRK